MSDRDAKLRTCASCGMVCDRPGEFHPHMFCVLKRAGRDPWEDFRAAARFYFGEELPERPPLVRDLPTRRGGGGCR